MNEVAAAAAWPAEGLERVASCPVCGGSERVLLHEGLRDRIFFCAPGEWVMFRCARCGCGYLDPRPTPQTVSMAYRRYFTHATKVRRYEDRSALERLRYRLANGYRNARFGSNRQPSTAAGAWLTRLLPRYRAIVEADGRHLVRPWPGARLLDVGCGTGEFLQFATEMGWKAEGVDFDREAVRNARSHGLDVREGSVTGLRDRRDAYDVITMSHVIEHVHDPRELLATCFDLLKPGGRLWVETPNLDAHGHLRYGRSWRGLEPPRHLILFTLSALTFALRGAGYVSPVVYPRRPLARRMFSMSAAIESGRDPYAEPDDSLRTRWAAWRADFMVKPRCRELITISALKPGSAQRLPG